MDMALQREYLRERLKAVQAVTRGRVLGTVCTALLDWCITWAFPVGMETTQGFYLCIYPVSSLSPLMILAIFKESHQWH